MKLYPFSAAKHAPDIEYYHSYLCNTMLAMEDGDIPFNADRYDRMSDLYNGELKELYDVVSDGGNMVYLTGKQIALARKIVFWVNDRRSERLRIEKD